MGLNILSEDFNESSTCTSGGLYFSDFDHIVHWFELTPYTKWVCEVELCENSKIVVIKNGLKYKTNQMILKNKMSICDFVEQHNLVDKVINLCLSPWFFLKESLLTEDTIINIIEKYPKDYFDMVIQYIDKNKQTPRICNTAVKMNGIALAYIDPKFQTPELCAIAVDNNPSAMQYVVDQTPELCNLAISKGGELCDIKNQTPELCLQAVKRRWTNLAYVKQQTFGLCMIAVNSNIWALDLIKDATIKKTCMQLRNLQ